MEISYKELKNLKEVDRMSPKIVNFILQYYEQEFNKNSIQ